MNRYRLRSAMVFLVSSMVTQTASSAAQCAKQSPAHRVALIELYTSEGCDSCPPADKWLSSLQTGERIVPLALHVDYWDQLGWKDRFASPLFTERQRVLSALGGSRVVYTPGVYLNLREFRGWSSDARLRDAVAAIDAKPAGADIRLELAPGTGQIDINAGFKLRPGAAARQPQAFIALYESRLSTSVRAGENRGATSEHDNVVRRWIGPLDPKQEAVVKRTLPLEREWKAKDLGVAAFVQNLANGEVLQAASLPLCSL